MKILELEQGSPEWLEARRCKVTGTRLKAVMSTAEARRGLIAELISEEATEMVKPTKPTAEMERGTAEEAFAIRHFAEKTGKKVEGVGMVVSDEFDWLAVSPDGLIKNGKVYEEAVEVKSPDSKKAILYRIENMIPPEETGLGKWSKPTKLNPEPEFNLLAGAPFLGVPSDYKWQVVQYFLVIDILKKLSFLVYDARMIDEDAKLYVVEVERDAPEMQEALWEAKTALQKFRADWLAWKEIVLPTNF